MVYFVAFAFSVVVIQSGWDGCAFANPFETVIRCEVAVFILTCAQLKYGEEYKYADPPVGLHDIEYDVVLIRSSVLPLDNNEPELAALKTKQNWMRMDGV